MEGNGLHQIEHYGTVLVSHGVTHRISFLTSTLIAHYMGKYCCFCKGIKKNKNLTLFFTNWLFYSFIGMARDIRDAHK